MLRVATRTLVLSAVTALAAALPLSARAANVPLPSKGGASEGLYFGDEVVESAAHTAKSLSQVPENVTVIHADEIEAMNAHTLGEVLNRVTGVFVQFQNGGALGDTYVAHIQGSGMSTGLIEDHHVMLLIDGVPWVSPWASTVIPNSVPVGIIDKIEVIKGPASSTWGSALGGVINVITKKTGTTLVPQGRVSGAYGERSFYDGRAEVRGGAGMVGYYLAGQALGADWQHTGAEYAAPSLFGKVDIRPRNDLSLGLALLSARQRLDDKTIFQAFSAEAQFPTLLGSATADARFGASSTLHLGVFYEQLGQKDVITWNGREAFGVSPPEGELFTKDYFLGRAWGAGGFFTWKGGTHTVTLGADYFNGHANVDFTNGPTAVDVFGFPTQGSSSTREEHYGIFLNDTILWGPLTLTPGLRFDDSSLTDGFWSPSLGATWKVGAATVVRAQLARGFSRPGLSDLKGNSMAPGNPDLKLEKVWSWEVGVETAALRWVQLKLTAFRHEGKDSLDVVDYETVNWPAVWRQGFEVEGESAPFFGFTATGGFAYTWVKRVGLPREQDQSQANLGLAYRQGTFRANLLGHYIWWDLGPGSHEARTSDFLWDLTASKTVLQAGPLTLDLFGTAHNLLNGRQSQGQPYNPSRWIEGGAKIWF